MPRTSNKVDSAKLLEIMMSKGLSNRAASRRCGISEHIFGQYVRSDMPITHLTATKLRRVFGEDVVYRA